MKTNKVFHRSLGLIVFLGGSVAFGQIAGGRSGQPSPTAIANSSFVNHAAFGATAQVKLGQLAEQRASNDEVKKLSQKVTTVYSETNKRLADLAMKQSLTLPGGLDKKDQATYQQLSRMSEANFDLAYMRHAVEAQEKCISEFKREAKSGSSPDLRGLASASLPMLEDQLNQALAVMQNLERDGMNNGQSAETN